MACFHPIQGYRSESVNPSGKRSITVVSAKARGGGLFPVQLPCGKCIGCRLEHSRQWAIRCVHEASLYERNCFITLTYNPESLPKGGTLVKKDFQDFMKRLRERVPDRIRFFHCGEYGEVCKTCSKGKPYCECEEFIPSIGRPHYHAALFNFDFSDKKLWKTTRNGDKLYVSELLDSCWQEKGHCTVGDLTFSSAAYVARYIAKKITGPRAEAHYGGRLPEYTTMSRRPGVGREWVRQWSADIFPVDSVVIRGKEMKVPKFYNRVFELEFPEEYARVKATRRDVASELQDSPDNSYERRLVREKVQELLLEQELPRKLENG